MDSPAENKRSAVLALALLGALLVGTLVIFTVFDGEDGKDDSKASATPSATAARGAGTGAGTGTGAAGGAPAPQSGSAAGVPPIVQPAELGAAHRVMADYMAGLNTFKHTDTNAAWVPPLLALTEGGETMKKQTVLPSDKAWATCQQARCSSAGKAVVLRDALIADELARGSGQTVSSVVQVTATRSNGGGGGKTETETNTWLVSARKSGGKWQVSGFDIYGLGNVGAPEPKGG